MLRGRSAGALRHMRLDPVTYSFLAATAFLVSLTLALFSLEVFIQLYLWLVV
jgi:hypothetical protein